MSTGPSPADDAGAGRELTLGQRDAERARKGADRGPQRPPTSRRRPGRPVNPPAAASSPEELEAAAKERGAQIARFWNRIAGARHWKKMSTEDAADLGAADLAIEAKRGVGVTTWGYRFPELLLAAMLLPYLLHALRSEWQRFQRARARLEQARTKTPATSPAVHPAAATAPVPGGPRYEGADLGAIRPPSGP